MKCAFLWPVVRSLCPASLGTVLQWCGLGINLRQARKLILGASPNTKTRLFSFNGTQSRAFIALFSSHNTLRSHLHLMGLTISPCGIRCGAKDKRSAYILCESEDLASLRQTYPGSFFLEPEY